MCQSDIKSRRYSISKLVFRKNLFTHLKICTRMKMVMQITPLQSSYPCGMNLCIAISSKFKIFEIWSPKIVFVRFLPNATVHLFCLFHALHWCSEQREIWTNYDINYFIKLAYYPTKFWLADVSFWLWISIFHSSLNLELSCVLFWLAEIWVRRQVGHECKRLT